MRCRTPALLKCGHVGSSVHFNRNRCAIGLHRARRELIFKPFLQRIGRPPLSLTVHILMPVIPYQINPFQNRKCLYQFLVDCHHAASDLTPAPIVSVAAEIEATDPLAVLQALARSGESHFYLEKPLEQEAIAAIGATACTTTEGSRRFQKTQGFIQSCLDRWVKPRDTEAMTATPRFFCGFTFFDHPTQADEVFPAAMAVLPRWQVTRQGDRHVATANLILPAGINLETLTEDIWQQFQVINGMQYSRFHRANGLQPPLPQWELIDTQHFRDAVRLTLSSIRRGHLDKLVLAHAVDVMARLPFQWVASLHNLRQLHPDCAIFSISHGQGKTFIGASPERLIRIRDRQLLTDALAGSAPRGQTAADDVEQEHRLLGSQKERHEHQVVVDFLCDRLARLAIAPHCAPIPTLLKLSNIQHLHTPISGTVPAQLHPLDILAELHPTPAVAGMPRDVACQEIQRFEGFGRSLYAAPLGWVDAKGNAEFIVGIRSALLDGNHARLYAGAGIVAGSDPERELAEVQLKLQALLRALI